MLSGIKVVELAGILAGPAVGMFFAELGATVYKIENPDTGGDATRAWKLPHENPTAAISAYYAAVNYGKHTIWANVERDAAAKARIEALLEEADIVITNFKHASALRLGFDAETLRSRYPRIIVAEISGYPNGDETPAFDVVLQAETGFIHLNGENGGLPLRMPVALVDVLAAHQLKEGILLALLRRATTGEGATVRVTLYEAALASLVNQASGYLMTGVTPERNGSLHPTIAPYGEVVYSADGVPLVLAVGTDRHFTHLCALLGIPALAHHPDYATNPARVRHRQTLLAALQAAFGTHQFAEITPQLKMAGVPCGAIQPLDAVFAAPAAKRMVLRETTADGTETARVRTAVFTIH